MSKTEINVVGPRRFPGGRRWTIVLAYKHRADIQCLENNKWRWRIFRREHLSEAGSADSYGAAVGALTAAWDVMYDALELQTLVKNLTKEAAKEIAAHYKSLDDKPPQTVANIFGRPIAQDQYGAWQVFQYRPRIREGRETRSGRHGGHWDCPNGWAVDISNVLLDYDGQWQDSLTYPSWWAPPDEEYRDLERPEPPAGAAPPATRPRAKRIDWKPWMKPGPDGSPVAYKAVTSLGYRASIRKLKTSEEWGWSLNGGATEAPSGRAPTLEAAMDAVQTAWDLMIYMALEYPAPTLLEDENEQ